MQGGIAQLLDQVEQQPLLVEGVDGTAPPETETGTAKPKMSLLDSSASLLPNPQFLNLHSSAFQLSPNVIVSSKPAAKQAP